MSLQLAAQHLSAKGRGPDDTLVHMSRDEVKSLNDLAMAHGGHLTINPHTGLPEAGFLSAILPMVAGAGLMMIPGMQASAAGLIVGGLKTAQSGSLSKGIMAGLGAYGGAGLAGSAGAAGASQVGVNATNQAASAAQGLEATQAAEAARNVASSATDMSLGQAGAANAANTANYVNPNYLDVGGTGSNYLPTGNGGITVTAPTPAPIPAASTPQYNIDGMGLDSPTAAPTPFDKMSAPQRLEAMKSGASFSNAGDFIAANPYTAAGAAASVASGMRKDPVMTQPDKDMGQRYSYSADKTNPIPTPDVPTYKDMLTKQGNYGRQQKYFTPSYTPISNTAAKDLYHYAGGGPIENMSNNAMMGVNTMYPMANITTSSYGTPDQMASGGMSIDQSFDPQNAPEGGIGSLIRTVMAGRQKQSSNPRQYTYDPEQQQYQQQATGGLSDARYNLGGYSDGGRLLRGPGDGVSDSIPAVIGKKQPARLADGEFVVPARIVSELGNGSTEAGARKLYAMMDRIQAARKKTVGKDKVAHNSRSSKYLPA